MTMAVVNGSPAAPARLGAVGKVVGPALLFAAFLSATGALDTEAAPTPARLAYWVAVSLLSIGALHGADLALRRRFPDADAIVLRAIGWALLVLPCTLFATLACKLLFGGRPSSAGFLLLLPGIASIAAALQVVLAQFATSAKRVEALLREDERDDTARDPVPLPLPLRGARIEALQAEDHYVRVHTDRGQALLRMRMRDAVAALDHVDGVSPHRSWWVARDAAASLTTEAGRAVLTLTSGLRVPVSRRARTQLGPNFRRP